MSTHHPESGVRRRGERNKRRRTVGFAVALSALAGGCASANAGTGAAVAAGAVTSITTQAPPPTTTTSTSSDMSMAPGAPVPDTTQTADGPSASALMVCGPEIQKAVTAALGLHATPITTTTWADHLYTCTYHSSAGQLVLSVEESADTAAANAYFATLRGQLGSTHPLTGAQGLGNPGYESPRGTVVILKDGKTLKVDATGMPVTSGPAMTSRSDLAYEIATDILGCWSEK